VGAPIRRDPTAPAFRLFELSTVGHLTLSDLALGGGYPGSSLYGGAIYSRGR